jgi:flagellar protein FlhE
MRLGSRARAFSSCLPGRLLVILSLLLPLSLPAVEAAPGSWQARIPSLRLAVPGRERASAPLQPPALARGQRLAEVRWRFELPAGAPVRARLCHPQRCIELSRSRGRSAALAGLDAGQPLQFRFRLAPRGEAQRVEAIELIVEYRRTDAGHLQSPE